MDALQFTLESDSDDSDLATVRRGLERFNNQFAGPDNYLPLNVFVRSDDGRVIGGLLGGTFWRWLSIDVVWLANEVRGQGVGSQLLKLAEDEAMRRGCHHALVDSLDFQAPAFYRKQGYATFGELADCPEGHVRTYMHKMLLE